MITRARKAFKDGKLLEEFCPVPKSLHIVSGRVGEEGSPEQVELEAQEKANLEAHGYSTWYDYCVNEWGTKWDVGGDDYTEASEDNPNATWMSFDSAWAPPCAAMDKMMDLGFRVTLYYYESGMCFAGIYDENGDDYYELSDMNSEQVAESLPSKLDEMFCISEGMAEWEEDNKEEADEV
jgi:hypothetical protein